MQSIQAGAHRRLGSEHRCPDLYLYSKPFMGALFFLTTPHYFIVLLRYSAFQLVLFFLRHIVMAVWQAHGGGKLLGVAIWILEAIPGSIKTLTLAKSLVSLSYYADGVGKGCSRRGTQEVGASGRPALPDPIEPDSDGGWLSRISKPGLKRASVPQQRKERVCHS